MENFDWDDVTPIPQDDGPNPIISINYSSLYRAKMDMFRAILHNRELSERALHLTEDIVDDCPAQYTVWQYRRECLRHLKSNLSQELDYMDTFAEDNPKNYQIWYHRRAVVEEQVASLLLSDSQKQSHGQDLNQPVTVRSAAKRELVFTAKVFATDPKNYHAWAHRQWVLGTLCLSAAAAATEPSVLTLLDDEISFIESLLKKDIRNNSVWNERWFIVHKGTMNQSVSASVLQHELNFAFSSLSEFASKNESVWNYVRGFTRRYPECTHYVIGKCLELEPKLENEEDECDNVFALSLVADLRGSERTVEALHYVERLLLRLADIDSIRIKYWNKRIAKTRVDIRLLLDDSNSSSSTSAT